MRQKIQDLILIYYYYLQCAYRIFSWVPAFLFLNSTRSISNPNTRPLFTGSKANQFNPFNLKTHF